MSNINPDSLFQNINNASNTTNTALESWDPPYCGEIDITIHSNGHWSYLDSPIHRKALIKLFSSVLRKDDDDYYLVTPVEKVKITVESEAFITTSFEFRPTPISAYAFHTNLEDVVVAGSDHPIIISENAKGEPHPKILIRNNLFALISRSDFYQLIDSSKVDQSTQTCTIESLGETFVLGKF